MANEEHLRILNQGVDAWNTWRIEHPEIQPDLSGAHLRGADLNRANLSRANLTGADLTGAHLNQAELRGANLRGADLNGAHLNAAHLNRANLNAANLNGAGLIGADLNGAYLNHADLIGADLNHAILIGADLSGADLNHAILSGADLSWAHLNYAILTGANLNQANLSGADLSWANVNQANLSGAKLEGTLLLNTVLNEADLTACCVYGVSAWGIHLEGAKQTNLIITPADEPAITVDNLEVAQFIYLLLNNEKIRDVIDTITSKVVLILGRFTGHRKLILEAVRDELRRRDYLPVLFDFEKPSSRNFTETVTILARLARFVIADLTEPRSIAQELAFIVPDLPSVPVQPLLAISDEREYAMFLDFKSYPWVLETHRYRELGDLLASLGDRVIAPAEAKAKELTMR